MEIINVVPTREDELIACSESEEDENFRQQAGYEVHTTCDHGVHLTDDCFECWSGTKGLDTV